ncbi:hypothetical protein Taro_004293 [Colocasia esculenta]|uniref:Caleosin n=1 Tax=Colocasia esculenta TaxID=4460 RepID=A0A843TJP5_COLES|nr:hypothetical protein [Colocasia esculenta]
MASSSEDPSLETYAPEAPVTGERKISTSLQDKLPKPSDMARAMAAVDKYHPRGTEGKDSKGMSVLQQHVSFFDRNKDGVIYPWETFQGCRAIGLNLFMSFSAAILINLALGYSTLPVVSVGYVRVGVHLRTKQVVVGSWEDFASEPLHRRAAIYSLKTVGTPALQPDNYF